VQHFIADEPPASLVERLTRRFIETEGDLWEVAKGLVNAPESWAPEQAKIKRPGEWNIACLRAAGLNGDARLLVDTALGPLRQPRRAGSSPVPRPSRKR
jgi:uncharacterized protein (DUF1800 family)